MIDLRLGDCKKVMTDLIGEGVQVDSIVTDPPYHLQSIVDRFGKDGSAPAKHGKDGSFGRLSKGFIGQDWDGGGISNDPEMWNLALQLLKPGGHMLAFGGSGTYHRMVCAIEDAGFEIRDCLMWIYGTGFPKSHNIGRNVQKTNPENEDWVGWGTALKPAFEPIVLARKPLSEKTIANNVLKNGVGAINIEESRNGSRYPANVLHDGSEEVVNQFGESSRFFYCAKASKSDKGIDNTHPTVKPTQLMEYLINMITPKSGIILDPFMGSGSTGKAATKNGFDFIGIDMTEEYVNIAKKRVEIDNE